MSNIPKLLEQFRRGPELIAAALAGTEVEELDFIPAPGKWSVRQILCHLADAEIVAAARFRRLLAEDGPTLMSYDQDAWARNLNYARRRTSDALEIFRRLRAENWDLLKDLPETAFERKATHSERGAITLLDLLKTYADHPEAHARQLLEVRNRYKQAKKQHA